MKRRNTGGLIIGVVFALCIVMAFLQYRKDQRAEEETVENPLGITVTRIEEDEEYDISKDYYEDYDDTGLETYVITGVFSDEETYIKEVREAGICEYIYKNEDGNGEVKVTEKQRKKWLKTAEENIESVLKRLDDEEMCNFTVNEAYTELHAQATKQYSAQQFLSDVEVILYNAEIMQVFTGTKDWSVHFVVQNMNTGYELVNIQYPQEGWNVTPDMWDE